jgi:hypothetical protein
MLSLADRPIEEVITSLAGAGVEAGYLVPTQTGLEKSILDAHEGLRSYFRSTKFHDYQIQSQGKDSKRVTEGFFVTPHGLEKTRVSLYRPETKTGDPRIWVYGLKDRVRAGNLLAVFAHDGALYIVNTSDRSMVSDLGQFHPHLAALIGKIICVSDQIAMELLSLLRGVAKNGWVQSRRNGPTGVGYTLESYLGIQANSNKTPDYKGIELKAGRSKGGRQTSRTTLFSKTPDWKQSSIHSGLDLMKSYGYNDPANGRRQLYCSLNNAPNTLGHFLEVQADDLLLHSMHQATGGLAQKVLQWDMDDLRNALGAKHKETFWVKAAVKKDAHGQELFAYTDVVHTKGPLLSNMVEMLRLGRIELDYLIHEEINRKGRPVARDHGYLFKMWQKNLVGLFPPSKSYKLM